MGAKKNESKPKLGERAIGWLDAIPIEETICYMALYSLFCERNHNQAALLSVTQEEFSQRVIEVITWLLPTLISSQVYRDEDADLIIIQHYIRMRYIRHGVNDISSSEGKAIWQELWKNLDSNPVTAKIKEKALKEGVKAKKEHKSFDDPLKRQAEKNFLHFRRIFNRALRRLQFLFQQRDNDLTSYLNSTIQER